jgi:hypothetical protein
MEVNNVKKKIILLICGVPLLIATASPVTCLAEKKQMVNTRIHEDLSILSYSINMRISNLKSNDVHDIIRYDGNDEALDQRQTRDCRAAHGVSGNYKLAQSFTPSLKSLTKVDLLLFKRGSPAGLIISIRDDLDGSDLTSIQVDGNKSSLLKNWYTFDLPDISTTPNHVYYIIWQQEGEGDIENAFFWFFGAYNPYKKGCAWFFNGNDWEKIEDPLFRDIDFCFKTYGEKAKNKQVLEKERTELLQNNVLKNKALGTLFLKFLEQHPRLSLLLKQLLKL